MTAPLLEVANLSVAFRGLNGNVMMAVEDVSFDVIQGEALGVVGESGCGKTMTGLSVLGLTPAGAEVSGSIKFLGRELVTMDNRHISRIRGCEIAMIYQDPLSALNPVFTVGEQIVETIRAHEKVSKPKARRRACDLLERVQLPEPERVMKAFPHELSGGMRQRALIAMALVCGPKLLIADEPTTALDVTVQAQIIELLGQLQAEMGLTVMLITHNMGVVANFADRVLVMYLGRVAELGETERVFAAPAHPYSAALLRSAHIGESEHKSSLFSIRGMTPSIQARPPGCPFHPRCGRAGEICRTTKPEPRCFRGAVIECHFPLEIRWGRRSA